MSSISLTLHHFAPNTIEWSYYRVLGPSLGAMYGPQSPQVLGVIGGLATSCKSYNRL